MARPPLADLDDLIRRVGSIVDAPDAALVLLEQASAIVRAYAGQTWLDSNGALSGVPDDIPGVVVSMVERATRNPDGLAGESVGPFSRSFGPAAYDRLYLTKAERMVIRAAVGNTGIGTISTTRGSLETAWPLSEMWPEEDLESMPWAH